MKIRVTRIVPVTQRIFQLRRTVKVDSEQLRLKILRELEALFTLASDKAQGKGEPLSLEQRQKWAKVAAYTAQAINKVLNCIDEKQVDEDLGKLEELLRKAKAAAEAKSGEEKASEKC